MKKIIIHVGQYKTGSTSIQKMLSGARDDLLKHGVLYPASFVRDGAHFQLTDLMRKEFRKAVAPVDLQPLRDEIENSIAETVVISCEPLSGATVRRFAPDMMSYMWQRLASLFEGHEIRVLYYARRQDESIDSRIIQEIKGQSRKTSIDYQPFLYPNSSLNYLYFTKQLEQVFGEGAVDCRLYDRRFLFNGDVRYDMLEYLGLPKDAISLSLSEDNVSPSAKLVAFYRFVNSLGLGNDDYAQLTSGAWKGFCSEDEPKAVVLDEEARHAIMEYFHESNRAFVSQCIPFAGRDSFESTLFKEPKKLASNVSIDCVEAVSLLRSKGFEMAAKHVPPTARLRALP